MSFKTKYSDADMHCSATKGLALSLGSRSIHGCTIFVLFKSLRIIGFKMHSLDPVQNIFSMTFQAGISEQSD